LDIDVLEAPFCILEHLTKKSVFVKCGWINTTGDAATYELLPFFIVAVGPRDPGEV
jgi:hypothetical protein